MPQPIIARLFLEI
jgi:hypothetical protein